MQLGDVAMQEREWSLMVIVRIVDSEWKEVVKMFV